MLFETNENIKDEKNKIIENVLIKLIKKMDKITVKISAEDLKKFFTINLNDIIDELESDVYFHITAINNEEKFPTFIINQKCEKVVNLELFEVINIINFGNIL